MNDWSGYVGIVTGASRGLGRAIAKEFAVKGAIVGIGYYKSDTLAKKTIEEINADGGKAYPVQADVRDADEVKKAIRSFIKTHGKIDFLINNAAIVSDGPLVLMGSENWSSVLQTNLDGVYNCTQAVVRKMISQGNGVIVNIGSVAGFRASVNQANYAASKGAVIALTKTLAHELAPYGIRVNSVVPGLLNDGMAKKIDKKLANQRLKQIPLSRFGESEEVARAVLFLASSEAGYITGQSLIVDGGLSI